jgi:hypothetical protein
LQSDETGTASLIHNTNNVPATIKRYISGAAEAWHLLASPVSNQSISGSWLPFGNYGDKTKTGKGTGYDLYLWDEPSNCWIYKLNPDPIVNWNSLNPGSDFVTGRGYLYSLEAINQTKEFDGNLNNGTINYGLTRGIIENEQNDLNGFNLIGNPYPSSVDWSASSGWIRSNLVNSGGGYDMWIWNPSANNYGVYNSFTLCGTNDVTQYIAPMQGYFVRAQSNGNLTMDNSVRMAIAAGTWKNAEIKPDNLSLIVQSTSDNSFDEVELLFGYNRNQIGAVKLFSHVVTAPSLYLPWADEFFSVRYLTDTVDNSTIPVMFKPGRDGNYTLTGRFNFDQFEIVLLEDLQTNVIQNLKTSQTYLFNASKTDNYNRFRLHFGMIKSQQVNELLANITTDGTNIIIDLTTVQLETEVLVYDILGRVVLQKKLQGEIKHILNYNTNTQLLIVCLKNREGNLYKKVFLEMK